MSLYNIIGASHRLIGTRAPIYRRITCYELSNYNASLHELNSYNSVIREGGSAMIGVIEARTVQQ